MRPRASSAPRWAAPSIPAGKSAHHDEAVRGQLEAESLGHPEPGFARGARADHRHAGGLAGFEHPARD
ncbi:MAG TPA: hypothetical protein VMI09_07905 [Candidatus Binataceae bacterium]|nr:hypothetical protein [Candidatus Binataceae bacterium]